MVPRPDLIWTERDTPVEKVLRLALKSGYSRIPVLGEGIDDVIGIAYLKDLVRAREEARRGEREVALLDILRPAAFVPDSSAATTSCARCSAPATTWPSSSTSTAVPPGW